MGKRPSVAATSDVRARMAVRLNQARPSHVWTPFVAVAKRDGSVMPGCSKCPAGSPFQMDRKSHLYIIEEEP